MPPSDLKGESTWPTQPLPVKPPPFSRQAFTEADVTDISDARRAPPSSRSCGKVRTGRPVRSAEHPGHRHLSRLRRRRRVGRRGLRCRQRAALRQRQRDAVDSLHGRDRPARRRAATSLAAAASINCNCAACHGVDSNGDPAKVFPSLVNLPKKMPRAEADKIIAGGKAVMPAVRGAVRAESARSCWRFSTTTSRWPRPDARRTDRARRAVHAHRLQPVPRSRRVSGREAALGHDERHRPQQGRDRVAGAAWRVPGAGRSAGRRHTGTENYGGPIITAGGLIFIGATKDEKFRALRQAHRQGAVGSPAAGRRLRHAEPPTSSTASNTS